MSQWISSKDTLRSTNRQAASANRQTGSAPGNPRNRPAPAGTGLPSGSPGTPAVVVTPGATKNDRPPRQYIIQGGEQKQSRPPWPEAAASAETETAHVLLYEGQLDGKPPKGAKAGEATDVAPVLTPKAHAEAARTAAEEEATAPVEAPSPHQVVAIYGIDSDTDSDSQMTLGACQTVVLANTRILALEDRISALESKLEQVIKPQTAHETTEDTADKRSEKERESLAQESGEGE